MATVYPPDRLPGVDLTTLPDEKMAALRRESIRLGISINDLLAKLIDEASARLLERATDAHHQPTTGDIIAGAIAARTLQAVETTP